MVNNIEYLGFSQPMALAIAEALKVNPYPTPRVGAVLTDKTGNIKAISNHVRKGKRKTTKQFVSHPKIQTEVVRDNQIKRASDEKT